MSSYQVEAKLLSRYDVSIELFNQKPNSFRSERDFDIFEIGLRESFDRITQEEIEWMATPRLGDLRKADAIRLSDVSSPREPRIMTSTVQPKPLIDSVNV